MTSLNRNLHQNHLLKGGESQSTTVPRGVGLYWKPLARSDAATVAEEKRFTS